MSIKRAALPAAAVVLAVGLTACGNSNSGTTAAPSHKASASVKASAATPAPDATESSVKTPGGATYRYPDHVTLHLAAVTRLGRSDAADVTATQTPVKVTIAVTGGLTDVPLDDAGRWLTVLYGPGRTEASQDAGYNTDDPAHAAGSTDPTRIAKTVAFTVYETFDVPTASLGALAVQIDIPTAATAKAGYAPWIFTDINTLLH